MMMTSFSFFCRCSVLGILHWYNVVIPPVVIELLKGSVNDFEGCLLKTVPFVEAEDRNMEFHNLRLKDLRTLNEILHQFLTPIVDLIDFLVHFSMHDSRIFSQYLWERLIPPDPKVPAVPAKALVTSTVFAGLEDVILQDSTAESDVDTMQVSMMFCILYQKLYELSRVCVFASHLYILCMY